MRLKGKIGVVTGGASGIGQATAILFAREGAKTVVADWNEEGAAETLATIKKEGGEAIALRVDVSSEDDIRRMIDETVKTYGGIDILFNNAAIAGIREGRDGLVEDIELKDWEYTLGINLRGVYLGCKHAIPLIVKRGGGAVVNTTSVAALLGQPFAVHAYTAAKGGIISLTRSLAVSYGPDKVRVNAVAPGAIATPMSNFYEDEFVRNIYLEGSCLNEVGQPEDVAHTVLFLASDESKFITGQVIVVDGGHTAKA